MYGYIYKTVNLINQKFYIGQKHSKVFLKNKYLGSGYLLKKAVKKYGKENFEVFLLDTAESKMELDEKEIFYIEKFNAKNSELAYNISRGGQGGQIVPPHIQTKEEKAKRSKSLKIAYAEGKHAIINNKGKKLRKRTEEENKANSERQKGKIWIKNIALQKQKTILPNEIDKYLSEGWIKGRFKNSKPAWNKGLSKENNESLKNISENRKKLFKERGQIGCFGEKGNTNGFIKGHEPWNKG